LLDKLYLEWDIMKYIKWTVFGIVTLMGLTALSMIVSAAPIVIDFEDLTTGGPGQGGQVLVFHQYANKGITFNDPFALDYSKGIPLKDFAHSGTKAIEQCYSKEFCTTPIEMNFTAGQKRVKVWVGYSAKLAYQRTVILHAFDSAGAQVGQATATFQPGNAPIPIQTPMEVISDSANIYSVTINFAPSPTYGKLETNSLAVDDVEFDTAGPAPPCWSYQPPIVKLVQPVGQTIQFNEFSIQGGTVFTTAQLENATLIITGAGGSNSLDLLSTGLISRNGGTFPATRIQDMLFPGPNTITVKVQDCKYSSENSTTVIFEPITGTIKCIGLEVTQGIQDMENTVPLIADKRTFVRAYLRIEGPTIEIHNVSGTLWGARPLNSGYPPVLDYPLKPYGVESMNQIVVDSSTDIITKRRNTDASLNFELPPEWITEGRLHLSLGLNSKGHPLGSLNDGCDNLDSQGFPAILKFEKAPPVELVLFNVPYTVSNVTYEPRQADFDLLHSWLQRVYPTDRVIISQSTISTFKDKRPGIDFTADHVNIQLWLTRIFSVFSGNMVGSEVKYYGLVNDTGGFMIGSAMGIPSDIASGPAGSGSYGWDTDGSYADWYGGHEIGHMYGRSHPGFGSDTEVKLGLKPCGTTQTSDDSKYPFPNGYISGPDMRFFGFDAGDPGNGIQMAVYDPAIWTDVMTYRCNEWISNYTYEGILDNLKILDQKGLIKSKQFLLDNVGSDSNDSLLVQGIVNLTDNSIELLPFMHLPNLELTPRPDNGSFSISLFDGTGERLASYPFEPKIGTDIPENESKSALIAEVIPYIEGTSRIVITKDGQELAFRNVSANPPQIEIIYPNGGEELDENTVNVSWRASDEDSDQLTYTILYSADAGETWQAVATNLEEMNYTVDLQELPGSNSSLFSVIATDGVNTGKDESNAVFYVPNKVPQAQIISPGDNSSFSDMQTIVLVGEAFDREDGYLDDKSVQWSSDKQGVLGFNSSISATELMPGDHTITLTAKDKNGAVTNASIRVHITQVAPVADAGPDRVVTVGSTVQLNGSNSSGFEPLYYKWEIVSRPEGSQSNISNTNTSQTEFIPDFFGEYVIQLLVKDTTGAVAIDRITVTGIPPNGTETSPTYAYITNAGSNTVSVIDTATNTIRATVSVGSNPNGVAVTPDGTKVYVANSDWDNVSTIDTISVIDTAIDTVIARVPVGNKPWGAAAISDGTKVYVTNEGSDTVSVIDATTNNVIKSVPVGSNPRGIVVSPDGKTVYVTNSDWWNNISVIDTVFAIDTATNTVIANVSVGDKPWGVAVSPDGTKLYVANYGSNTTSVIDTATNSVTATVPVGWGPVGVAVTPDGKKVYVASYHYPYSVSIIDTATNTVTATVNVGMFPHGVAVTPDGTKAYVTSDGSDKVYVIDTATNNVTGTVKTGSRPMSWGQFIGPAPNIIKMSTPVQLSPKNESVYSNYPRTTTLEWSPVPGAVSYTVEVDCYHCCQDNKWCTDIGRTWMVIPDVTTTNYTFDFVGAQPGRWRVWAVNANGQASLKSQWWYFTYKI